MTSALTIATTGAEANYWVWRVSSIFLLKSVRIRALGKDEWLSVGFSLSSQGVQSTSSIPCGPGRHRLHEQHSAILLVPSFL